MQPLSEAAETIQIQIECRNFARP